VTPVPSFIYGYVGVRFCSLICANNENSIEWPQAYEMQVMVAPNFPPTQDLIIILD